ncbi:MAG: phosphopyruvate hydratase [Caldisericaceae bacterium]
MSEILALKSREILDSRGYPTVETEVFLESGFSAKAQVPSGKSTGKHEAVELRDNDKSRYDGKGVLTAVANVNEIIAENVVGMDSENQALIDNLMIDLDGTDNKGKLGANAILSVSLAVARATAVELGIPLYRYIGGLNSNTLPVPQFNILNGGEHADSGLDIQEFLILPAGLKKFSDALRAGSEIYHKLAEILKKNGYSISVGDEGGFAPRLKDTEEAVSFIVKAITEAGYVAGSDVFVGIDSAANSFYREEGYYDFEGKNRSSKEMIEFYESLTSMFPIISIEDGLSEEDWDGWVELEKSLGSSIQLVGDDIYVTNPKRLARGIELSASNSVLIKLNQIGTLTETIQTVNMATHAGFNSVVSHRSGETADAFISHLVVGLGTGQIKSGAPCRVERLEKYNELLRIEEELGDNAIYAGLSVFGKFLRE